MRRSRRVEYQEEPDPEYVAKLKELVDERTRLEQLAQARQARVADLEQEQRDLAALAVNTGDTGRPVLVMRYGAAASELSLIPAELKVVRERINLLTDQIGALQDRHSGVIAGRSYGR